MNWYILMHQLLGDINENLISKIIFYGVEQDKIDKVIYYLYGFVPKIYLKFVQKFTNHLLNELERLKKYYTERLE